MYLVEDLYKKHAEAIGLELVAGQAGLRRKVLVPEAHRAGLALSGYLKGFASKRLLVFGKQEVQYLQELPPTLAKERLQALFAHPIPAVIVTRRIKPPQVLMHLCEAYSIPLFRAPLTTLNFLSRLTLLLLEDLAPCMSCHGTLVEMFGVGVLIQGDSSVGKSEAALGLIERGHRLISDDIVKIKKRERNTIEGSGGDLTRHHMEIRGIGIINVANLYGAVCVCDRKNLDLVVKLEVWDDQQFYDRVGLEEKHCEMLGVQLPYHILPVKPGRDVVLLLETIALNHRLKLMGYNSAKEFKAKLLEMIASKQTANKRSRRLETLKTRT
jgi:HPr kinase/phosphorylase